MKKTAIALFAAAGAFAAASAFAGHHEGKEGDYAAKMNAKLEAKFAEVDADGSGAISRDEYMAYKMAAAEASWAEHGEFIGDDGEVSLAEAKAYHAAKRAKKKEKMKEHKMMKNGDKN